MEENIPLWRICILLCDIADGNARQNRFKNATAKERARAMEEELAAMSEELEAQGDSDLEESEEDSAPETKKL